MKFIDLKKSDVKAIVDDDMFDEFRRIQWWLDTRGYVRAHTNIGNKFYAMHHLVLGKRPSGTITHHKNGIRHDNRRENLEYVTYKEHNRHHAKANAGKRKII